MVDGKFSKRKLAGKANQVALVGDFDSPLAEICRNLNLVISMQ
jgi:hypothetical protein